MKDDMGDLTRRALWFAGGCAALGSYLILRMSGVADYPIWITWVSLFLSFFIVPAAVETGYYNIDLGLNIASAAASVLGLLLWCLAVLLGRTMDDLMNLGPLFTLVGFATGTVCNGLLMKDVAQDLIEEAKKNNQEDDEIPEGTPTRVCPSCGKRIPTYVAACRYCRHILVQ